MPDSVYMPQIVPLDDKFYALDAEELAFYKAQTGIHDDDALKQHIMRVQADAYQVRRHPNRRLIALCDRDTRSIHTTASAASISPGQCGPVCASMC